MPPADFDGLRNTAMLRLDEFSAQATQLGIEACKPRLIEYVPRYGLLMQSRYADLPWPADSRHRGAVSS